MKASEARENVRKFKEKMKPLNRIYESISSYSYHGISCVEVVEETPGEITDDIRKELLANGYTLETDGLKVTIGWEI